MTTERKASYRIVASDLDGTLLAPDHQVSAFAKQTLHTLHQQGYTFIFATGRHHIDVAGIRESVGIPAYMITSNGARVHDQTDQAMYSKNIAPHLVQSIIDLVKGAEGIFVHLYRDEDWLLSRENNVMRHFHRESGFTYQIFDADNAPTNGVAKILFTNESRDHRQLVGYEERINQHFAGQVNVAFSTPWCLEVMAEGVSKGEALQVVAQSLGLTLEHCLAFGDGMNDVEMLTMAGKGLVMGTAHEKVLHALPDNEVIGSNAEDAVAHYLQQHLLAKLKS